MTVGRIDRVFLATSNIKASKCVTISVSCCCSDKLWLPEALLQLSTLCLLPHIRWATFHTGFSVSHNRGGCWITEAALATVHPSFTQLPLMSVHRWGRENQCWFLFHTQADAPFSSAVSCQQRTKLVKPLNPLIMICFLAWNFIPNHSKRSPQADTGQMLPEP